MPVYRPSTHKCSTQLIELAEMILLFSSANVKCYCELSSRHTHTNTQMQNTDNWNYISHSADFIQNNNIENINNFPFRNEFCRNKRTEWKKHAIAPKKQKTIATMLRFVNSSDFSLRAHIFHTDTAYVVRLQQVQKFITSNTVECTRSLWLSTSFVVLFVHSCVRSFSLLLFVSSDFCPEFCIYIVCVCDFTLRISQNTVSEHLCYFCMCRHYVRWMKNGSMA